MHYLWIKATIGDLTRFKPYILQYIKDLGGAVETTNTNYGYNNK